MTRLLLDVDGVLNAPDCAEVWGGDFVDFVAEVPVDDYLLHVTVTFAPPLIRALDELIREHGLRLTWVSTWNEDDLARRVLVPRLGALDGGEVLPFYTGGGFSRTTGSTWKRDGLLVTQRANPTEPFIWADDIEVAAHGAAVRALTEGTPSLLLDVDGRTGLTPQNIEQMRNFHAGLEDADASGDAQ